MNSIADTFIIKNKKFRLIGSVQCKCQNWCCEDQNL